MLDSFTAEKPDRLIGYFKFYKDYLPRKSARDQEKNLMIISLAVLNSGVA